MKGKKGQVTFVVIAALLLVIGSVILLQGRNEMIEVADAFCIDRGFDNSVEPYFSEKEVNDKVTFAVHCEKAFVETEVVALGFFPMEAK